MWYARTRAFPTLSAEYLIRHLRESIAAVCVDVCYNMYALGVLGVYIALLYCFYVDLNLKI